MAGKPRFPKGWGDAPSMLYTEKEEEERRIAREKRKPLEGLARQSKLTHDALEKITTAIRLGATYKLAAQYAGISEVTLYDWIKKANENPDSPYGVFLHAINEAEGKAALTSLSKIQKASERDWRAAAWLLERRHPESYGKTITESKVEVKAAVAPIDPQVLLEMSPEQLAALAGDMTKAIEDDS